MTYICDESALLSRFPFCVEIGYIIYVEFFVSIGAVSDGGSNRLASQSGLPVTVGPSEQCSHFTVHSRPRGVQV
jgi:hypothetical protein